MLKPTLKKIISVNLVHMIRLAKQYFKTKMQYFVFNIEKPKRIINIYTFNVHRKFNLMV